MNQAQFNFFRCPIISFENLVRVFYARVHLPNSFFLREPIATSG